MPRGITCETTCRSVCHKERKRHTCSHGRSSLPEEGPSFSLHSRLTPLTFTLSLTHSDGPAAEIHNLCSSLYFLSSLYLPVCVSCSLSISFLPLSSPSSLESLFSHLRIPLPFFSENLHFFHFCPSIPSPFHL